MGWCGLPPINASSTSRARERESPVPIVLHRGLLAWPSVGPQFHASQTLQSVDHRQSSSSVGRLQSDPVAPWGRAGLVGLCLAVCSSSCSSCCSSSSCWLICNVCALFKYIRRRRRRASPLSQIPYRFGLNCLCLCPFRASNNTQRRAKLQILWSLENLHLQTRRNRYRSCVLRCPALLLSAFHTSPPPAHDFFCLRHTPIPPFTVANHLPPFTTSLCLRCCITVTARPGTTFGHTHDPFRPPPTSGQPTIHTATTSITTRGPISHYLHTAAAHGSTLQYATAGRSVIGTSP